MRALLSVLLLCLLAAAAGAQDKCPDPPPFQQSTVAQAAAIVGIDVTSAEWERWCTSVGTIQGTGKERSCKVDPNWCRKAAGAASGAAPAVVTPVGATPAAVECDDFCRNLKTVLDDRGNFKRVRGSKVDKGRYEAKVYLPGALHCRVLGGRFEKDSEYTCDMSRSLAMSNPEAQVVFGDAVQRVQRSVPAEWVQTEERATSTGRTVGFRSPMNKEQLATVNVTISDFGNRSVVTVWVPRKQD